MKLTESKKVIAVIGSTGLQGGGLVRALLKDQDSSFAVLALTRNPDKDSAKEVAKAGAEVTAFDMDGSLDDMARALQGVYGPFVVTNYWEHFDQDRESKQVRAVIEAGEMAGVQQYVWSTLEDTTSFLTACQSLNVLPRSTETTFPSLMSRAKPTKSFPKTRPPFCTLLPIWKIFTCMAKSTMEFGWPTWTTTLRFP